MANEKIIKGLIKADKLENVLSRKGTTKSKSGANVFATSALLDGQTLRDLYNSGGIASKIITRVADDITRKGFNIIEGNEDVVKDFDRLKATQAFNKAIRWARLYGGSLITLTINDGRSPDKPLNVGKIREVEKLKVYEAGRSNNVSILKRYDNPKKANFDEPEIYQVNTGSGMGLKIHESRCIRLDGRAVDTITAQKLDFWGGSELQPVYDSLLSMFSQLTSGEQVLDELVIGVLKIENLDALCADSEGEKLLEKRLDLVDSTKSNENTLVIDMNEVYERHTVNLSGMSNLQQNAMTLVSGSADIPSTFLYGSSPDGQNATGASDEAQYYGKIDAERTYFYKPALLQLLKILTGEDYDVEFPVLKTENFYDTARAFNHIAKSFKDLVDSGIITPQEAKAKFYESGALAKIKMIS